MLCDDARFRRSKYGYQLGKPLVYLGTAGRSPDLRFDWHEADIQANRFVLEYGLSPAPSLSEIFNPMAYKAGREMEVSMWNRSLSTSPQSQVPRLGGLCF